MVMKIFQREQFTQIFTEYLPPVLGPGVIWQTLYLFSWSLNYRGEEKKKKKYRLMIKAISERNTMRKIRVSSA